MLKSWGVALREVARSQGAGFGLIGRCAMVALAAGLFAGGVVPAKAQTANEVSADCVLSSPTVAALQADVADIGEDMPDAEDVEVAFVMVYALNNDNDGQPLDDDGGYTGPILCSNPDLVGVQDTTQDAAIPGSRAVSVDTLDAEDVFILRYALNGGTNGGDIEKVICHTVDANVNCFRIVPVEP